MSPHCIEWINIGYGKRAPALDTFMLEDYAGSRCIGDQLCTLAAKRTADYATRDAGSSLLNQQLLSKNTTVDDPKGLHMDEPFCNPPGFRPYRDAFGIKLYIIAGLFELAEPLFERDAIRVHHLSNFLQIT